MRKDERFGRNEIDDGRKDDEREIGRRRSVCAAQRGVLIGWESRAVVILQI